MFNILNDQSGEEYYGFSYDKAGNYSAISAFCENDSNYYEFYDDNTYIYDDFYEYGHELNTEEPYDDGILDAGSYNFSDNKTIELKSEKSNDTKRLSFDSASVKDGDIIYFCNLFE